MVRKNRSHETGTDGGKINWVRIRSTDRTPGRNLEIRLTSLQNVLGLGCARLLVNEEPWQFLYKIIDMDSYLGRGL